MKPKAAPRKERRSLRILRAREVCAKYGFSGTSSLYEAMKTLGFPKPIKIGVRAVGWIEEEGDDWAEARRALRDQAAPVVDQSVNTSAGEG